MDDRDAQLVGSGSSFESSTNSKDDRSGKDISEPDGLSREEGDDKSNDGLAQPPVGRGVAGVHNRGTVCAYCGRRKGG